MRVCLVYCGIGVAGFNPYRPLGDREGSWIGHGIASIGASAKDAGYDVELIDLRQLAGWSDFTSRIQKNPADIYGLSVSAVDYKSALRAVIQIKKTLPHSKVILGGIHPTIFPAKYNFGAIDTVVTGEGEITFVHLIEDAINGKTLPKMIKGEKPDLDKLPWVDRELFDYKRELSCYYTPTQEIPAITMIAGRGCPYHCSFCQPAENYVFGKPYRIRSVENVISELVHLKPKYDYKGITFWDDTFTFNPKWVNRFCDEYDRSEIGAPFMACSRADIICNNEQMVERLSKSGLSWFIIGFESGSQRILDLISKGTTVEQNLKAASICRKYGIKVFATYMYGLPTESKEEAMATARMIDEINPDHPSPFYFIPIDGTDLHSFCKKHNLILESNGDDSSIERTAIYKPTIKGIDYSYLDAIRSGFRE